MTARTSTSRSACRRSRRSTISGCRSSRLPPRRNAPTTLRCSTWRRCTVAVPSARADAVARSEGVSAARAVGRLNLRSRSVSGSDGAFRGSRPKKRLTYTMNHGRRLIDSESTAASLVLGGYAPAVDRMCPLPARRATTASAIRSRISTSRSHRRTCSSSKADRPKRSRCELNCVPVREVAGERDQIDLGGVRRHRVPRLRVL